MNGEIAAILAMDGIASGAIYVLIGLGFVLIFKASGVFNFAQGVMVLFAALTLVGLMDRGVPMVLALLLTIAVMILLAFAIERLVLRPLVNQEAIILFMATIGLNFFLEGFGEMVWGANVKRLDVGIADSSFKVVPAKYSILHSRSVPSKGGNTEFAYMVAAYEALDADTKAEVEGLICEHSQIFSRQQLGFTDFTDEERARFAPVRAVT